MPSHWLLEGFIPLSGVTASLEPLQVGICGTSQLDCGVAINTAGFACDAGSVLGLWLTAGVNEGVYCVFSWFYRVFVFLVELEQPLAFLQYSLPASERSTLQDYPVRVYLQMLR